MTKTSKRLFGDWGEEQASLFLSDRRYRIVERNYQCRGGEIDIIAWHEKEKFGETLCFIEVKTRGYGAGSAERATDWHKLQCLMRAARTYCLDRHISIDTTPIQFEQVSVYTDGGSEPICKHDVIIVD